MEGEPCGSTGEADGLGRPKIKYIKKIYKTSGRRGGIRVESDDKRGVKKR